MWRTWFGTPGLALVVGGDGHVHVVQGAVGVTKGDDLTRGDNGVRNPADLLRVCSFVKYPKHPGGGLRVDTIWSIESHAAEYGPHFHIPLGPTWEPLG